MEWLDQLSLRYTLGLTGNVPNYSSSSLRTSAYTALSGTGTFMLTALYPANKHLKWESSLTHNIGIDIGLLRGRIEATIELYHKKTNNMLAPQIIDPTLTGKHYVYKNLADVTNKGIEFHLNTVNIKSSDLNWYSTLTLSCNSNRINRSDNRRDQAVGFPVSITGYDAGSLFAYRWAGLSNTGAPQFYYTEDGKDKITANVNSLFFKDFKHMGTVIPRYNMGLSNIVNYHNWSLSFMFIYSGGNVLHTDTYNDYNTAYATGDLVFNNVSAAVKDRWRTAGDESHTNVPAYGKAAFGYNYADINYQSADFIKLRDIVLAYQFRKKNFSWLPLENIELKFQARNTWKWVANDAGIDPEAYLLDKGLRTLPVTASYNFGINATF